MMGVAPSSGGKLGRYELHGAIARGGMATVYVARMSGAAGFARTVAVKRLHPHLAADSTFSAMFIDEARLAARIRHPNVIDTLDVVAEGGELFLVMDFVLGETLAKLVRVAQNRGIMMPAPVVSSIIIGALEGLHAAHEATSERGEPLGIVHRDVSPQNILVARDGVARVLDFGVAKAAGRVQETEGGELKGKLAYMAPEQLTRKEIDRRCDVFAMGVVLWEALTTKRLFAGDDAASTLYAVMNEPITPPSQLVPGVPPAVDEVVLKALERDVTKRFATAQEMAVALEAAVPPAPTRHAGKWVEELAADALKIRADIVRAIDGAASVVQSVTVPLDDLTGAQLGPPSSARIAAPPTPPPGTESWRHVPNGTPIDSPGMSGVSSVTHASGVSNASSTSHVTPHAHLVPAPAAANRDQGVKLLVIGGLFAAIAIIGIVMSVVALSARSRAAAAAAAEVEAAASPPVVATTPTEVPPSPVVAPKPAEPALELPAETAETAETPEAAESADAAAPQAAAPQAAPAYAKTAKPAPKPAAAADCADPFTVDANGIKRPKLQCFGPR
ncbi:MAG: serine/threonine protein kinase [Labilithrix sp.]|nr:serine/threonine protein kinase [Labilithrix sp.]MCW5817965.1 serine/threonine protein kinase [Labilithrix sp.]